jgi:predicted CXXCH cytochrome family protein
VKQKYKHQITKQQTFPVLIIFLIFSLVCFALITSNAFASGSADGTDPIFGADTREVPAWLAGPVNQYQLYSKYELATLAGHLVMVGEVDASSCSGGAFLQGGAANTCALELTRPAVLKWQNRFNKTILAASQETGVPPIVLKNIFVWESQFWPNTIFVNTYEYGLGHITEAGADSALRWNKTYYDKICRESFSEDTCQVRYADQPGSIRAALMGVVVQKVNVDCSTCAYGLDLPKTANSILVFANTLLSNANLVNQTITSLTGKPARDSVSYQDLWKFSLTSYNAGPGCFMTAFLRTLHNYKKLDWENFSSQLDPACRGAIKYVNFISNTDDYHPSDDPGLHQENTPTQETSATTTGELPTDIPTEIPTDSTPVPTVEGTPTLIEGTPVDATTTPTPQGTIDATSTEMTPVPSEPPATATPTTELPVSVADQLESPHVLDEVVLKIDPLQRTSVIDTLQGLGVNLVQDGSTIESLDTIVVQLESAHLGDVLAALQASTGVVFAEPNYLASLASLPNDPEITSQPNLWNIQAPDAWNALPSMQEVLVAVLDTGVEVTHPDLANTIWQNAGEIGTDVNGNDKRSNGLDDDGNGYMDDWQGWNMVAGNNNVNDDNGHGTHLAGIIGASVNNAIGIAGVAPNTRILPVKVLDNTGYGDYARVAEGITYATDMGARIINLGFAGLGSSQMLQDAVDYAIAHGVLVVAASGNGGLNTTFYPAAYPGVIAVSAVDGSLNWAPFSSSGDHISLVAPGVGIYSTYLGGTYKAFSGTSMASAHVSGVAALLAGQPQFATADNLRSALLGSAFDLGSPGKDPYFGFGIVHAFDALGYSGPVLPTPTPWIVSTSTPGGVGGVNAQLEDSLWARTQTSTYSITNPANSIDSAFNDALASITGPLGGSGSRNWTFTSFDPTTFSSVVKTTLEFRMYMTGWADDTYFIQMYEPGNGSCSFGWCTVFTFLYSPTNSIESKPTATLTTISLDITNLLNTPLKVNNTQFRIIGSAITGISTDNVTVYFDEVRLKVLDVLPPTPTPTSTPVFIPTSTLPPVRAITATPQAVEPHNNMSNPSTDTCASCHRGHTAQSMALRNNTGEEQVCFACHNGTGSGSSVQSAFTNKSNSTTRFFSHGVSSYLNLHQAEEINPGNFGGSLRHVECEDCHQPHSSSRTAALATNVAPAIQQEMYNSTGVDPLWTASGSPSGYSWLSKAEKEFQLCFKCHSSYTTLPSYKPDGYGWNGSSSIIGYIPNGLGKLTSINPLQIVDSRNLAQEFNPYQLSFHPIASIGRNQSIPAGSFVSPWTSTSLVYCTDCHQNASAPINGKGPHGSPNLHLLAGADEYITQTDPTLSCAPGGCPNIHGSGELCFKCHQYGTYAAGTNPPQTTRFKRTTLSGTENLHIFHNFAACYTCHDTHGSEQDRLINFDTSVVTIPVGFTSQTAWSFNYTLGVGSCTLSCHDGEHDSSMFYSQ